jgi:hypothetical protein
MKSEERLTDKMVFFLFFLLLFIDKRREQINPTLQNMKTRLPIVAQTKGKDALTHL